MICIWWSSLPPVSFTLRRLQMSFYNLLFFLRMWRCQIRAIPFGQTVIGTLLNPSVQVEGPRNNRGAKRQVAKAGRPRRTVRHATRSMTQLDARPCLWTRSIYSTSAGRIRNDLSLQSISRIFFPFVLVFVTVCKLLPPSMDATSN